MGVAGFVWGGLSDRYGARIVVLCGTVLLGAGLALASQARTLLEFQLCYGVLVGIAAGSFFAPLIPTVSSWFDQNRGLPVALVSVGGGRSAARRVGKECVSTCKSSWSASH